MAPESQKHNSKKFWVHQNGFPLHLKRNAFTRQKFNSSIHLWLSTPQLGRMAKNNILASFFTHSKCCIIGLLAARSHSQPLGQVKETQRWWHAGSNSKNVSLDPEIYLALFPPYTAVSQALRHHSPLEGWKKWLSNLSTWLLRMSSAVNVTFL